jgi:hypothetical protein
MSLRHNGVETGVLADDAEVGVLAIDEGDPLCLTVELLGGGLVVLDAMCEPDPDTELEQPTSIATVTPIGIVFFCQRRRTMWPSLDGDRNTSRARLPRSSQRYVAHFVQTP